jgi:hypothetical protein
MHTPHHLSDLPRNITSAAYQVNTQILWKCLLIRINFTWNKHISCMFAIRWQPKLWGLF